VIMLHAFPKEQRGMATAVFGMGVMVGPSIGPVLGGYLTDNFSWPWIFWINIPFGIAAVILTTLYVPGESRKRVPIDFVGMGLLAAGMGALQTVLERGQEEDWFSSRGIVVLSGIAAVSLVCFVWREVTTPYPVVDLRVFLDRSLSSGSMIGGLVGVSLYATLFLLPVYLQESQGYTAMATGMILMPMALVSMVSFMIAGPLSERVNPRVLVALGVALMAGGTISLSTLTTASGGDQMFWALAVRGASLGFLFIPLTMASLGGLPPEQIGVGSGMVNLARQLGGSVGIAALSTLLARRLDFHRAVVSAHLYSGNPAVSDWLTGVRLGFCRGGYAPSDAHSAALALLKSGVERQAVMLSFDDCFLAIGATFLLTLPLVLLLRKTAGGDLGAIH
ncbi:MAG: DHA2 family efflux MFS transporter permease subunit, partial [Capsulimonadaceae bacterium]